MFDLMSVPPEERVERENQDGCNRLDFRAPPAPPAAPTSGRT